MLNGQCRSWLTGWLGGWVMVLRGVIRPCLRATCNMSGTGTEGQGLGQDHPDADAGAARCGP